MKLNFTKVGGLVCPTDAGGQLVEDVLKCTVTSSPEQETIMTLTVTVKEPVPAGNDVGPHTDQITWECETLDCVQRNSYCTHAGSKPRLCSHDRGKPATWRPKG